MITWEHILSIADRSLQETLRTVEATKLAIALYGADEDIFITELGGGAEIPVIEITGLSGGIGVTVDFTNTGTGDGVDIPYSIVATGGILGMIDKQAEGTVNIPVGGTDSIQLPMIIGLGKVFIEVEIGSATQSGEATQILFFTML